ncbi:MAG: hypothetical protein SVT52_00310 [Planctomycetota bacterium]|nr:hypothetical protein [Planctomycetota bacterium]
MKMKRSFRPAVPATFMLAIITLAADAAPRSKSPAATSRPAGVSYGKAEQIAILANKQVHESSGLACGRANKDIFWTHNDSGDKARVFAFNGRGEHLATYNVPGAKARDWEDMCSFRLARRSVLLIGDVGDNASKRDHCTLYAINEPRLNPQRRNAQGSASLLQTIHFRYSQGPQNCESIAFDVASRTIYIITKVFGLRCNVYALPWPKRPEARTVVIKPVATLAIPPATAMDISSDGRRAVVLTYGPAYEYTRTGGQTWAEAFAGKPRFLPMPGRRQGESICYGPDGKKLYLTSEKLPTPLWRIPVLQAEPLKRPGGAK